MRTYDPADHIVYVHLAQDAAPAAPRTHDECRRLPAGYPNATLRARLGECGPAVSRPALVLLPGGSAAAEGHDSAAPVLRLAR